MEFRVLGAVEVVGEQGPVNLGGPQQRRILAALLADPGVVLTYDRLVEVLWPDGDQPDNARRSAISYVSRLRSAVGEGVVRTSDAGYLVDAKGLDIDAKRFSGLLDTARNVDPARAVEVLDEALGLWRGPVFGDLASEWWARPFAARLEELRLVALGERIDALAAGGWHGRALAEASAALVAHPLREQFVERAMRGLHAVGQRADALRAFQTYRAQLAEQTGLDPSGALVALDRSIASGEGPLEPSSRRRPLRGYVLRELIGEGSFGAVHRATQPGVDRDVALKVIRQDLVDDRSFVLRFEAEAQLVARLEHPHIVPLYDFWREPGGAYLVFRLLRGGSADGVLATLGPLSLTRASSLVDEIGSALAAAHAAGVVHRDVKPANILFDEAGAAYLADFGIAGMASPDDRRTSPVSAGSPLYASPEQLRDGICDHRADQYALAATVWELLVGHAPFAGDDASALVRSKLLAPVAPVSGLRPDLPTGVDAVLARATAVHPDDRYPDVAAFVVAWRSAVQAPTAAATDPEGRVDRRERAVARTAAGLGETVANPYKGLRPFREADAAEFAGRASLVARLGEAVAAHRFVAVVGPSGSGKSSVVLAGLVPQLRRAGCLVVTLTPGEDPFGAMAEALRPVATDDQAELVSSSSIRRPGGLVQAAAAVARHGDLVVVIDQLEELWTLAAIDERDRFAAALAALGVERSVRVVATVRADLFDRPLRDPVLGPLVAASSVAVTPMTPADLHDAVTSPAERVGVRFDPSLVSSLVAEAVDQPGSLPLLQFALTELFDRRGGATIGSAAYDEMGGLAGALSHQAEEIYAGFDGPDRAAVRTLFSRLVAPGEGNEDTRRRARTSELAGVPAHVVGAFVSRRLLTTDRDRETREPTVEVAHEVLLRSWPRLRGWLDEDRAWLRELRGLAGAAAAWDGAGRDDADLLRGARLAVVDELSLQHGASLTELEHRFLAASREQAAAAQHATERRLAEQGRQNRRLRRRLLAVAALLVLALVAGSVAFAQRRRADGQARVAQAARSTADAAAGQANAARDDARLTTLASRSLSLRSSQRDLAALLAVEAWTRRPDATAKSALFATFTADPGFLGFHEIDPASGVDGRPIPGTHELLLAPSYYSGTPRGMQVYDVETATLGAPFELIDPRVDGSGSLTLSADGRRAAQLGTVTGGLPLVAVFDVASGRRLGPPIQLTFNGWRLALDRTGTRLAVSGGTWGEVAIYDAASGTLVSRIMGLQDAPKSDADRDTGSVAWGPDGLLYVGSAGDRLRVFEPVDFTMVATIVVPRYASGGEIKFSADGSLLVAHGIVQDAGFPLGQMGGIVAVDVRRRAVLWSLTGDDFGYGVCARFALDGAGNRLWCSDYFGLIRERYLDSGALTGRTFAHQRGLLSDLGFLDTGTEARLISFGGNAGVIGQWRVDGAGPIGRTLAPGQTVAELSPDGALLLTGVFRPGAPSPFNNLYSVWDARTGAKLATLDDLVLGHWSGTGHEILAAFVDRTAGVFDVTTMTRTAVRIAFQGVPTASASLAGGRVLAIGYDDGSVTAFDVTTGAPAFPPLKVGDRVFQIAAGADLGRIVVATRSHGVSVFDAATGRQLVSNTGLGLSSLAVSRSGSLAIGTADGRLGLFDPATLLPRSSLAGARGFVEWMQFSDDGTLLMAHGNDNTVSLYDVATATRIGEPIVLPTVATSLSALTADGGEMVTSYPEAPAPTVWDLHPAHWATAACTVAGRNLTREEWGTYLADLGPYRATCPQFTAAA